MFIKEYAVFLREDIQEEEITYSEVVILFYQKDYEAIIFNLSRYELSSQYVLKTKNLIIRTYFELFLTDWDYLEILDSTLKAYEGSLYRNISFSEKIRDQHLSFISILKGLISRTQKKTPKKDTLLWLPRQLKRKNEAVGIRWFRERFLKEKERIGIA